ncbi:MAG: SRPBCC family protein [Candidatus Pacearchaeota archaeon]
MKKVKIERTFDAPIMEVWRAFTNKEILAKWWSPPGMSSSFLSVDLKIGGRFRFCFKGDPRTEMAGKEFWGLGEYCKIEKPTKLSYYDSFSDSSGNAVPPSYYGMPGKDEIEKLLIEFTFLEKGKKTHMTLIGDNSYDESMTQNMLKGWNGMFDKLSDFLKKR